MLGKVPPLPVTLVAIKRLTPDTGRCLGLVAPLR
jgi:hypothetical protein